MSSQKCSNNHRRFIWQLITLAAAKKLQRRLLIRKRCHLLLDCLNRKSILLLSLRKAKSNFGPMLSFWARQENHFSSDLKLLLIYKGNCRMVMTVLVEMDCLQLTSNASAAMKIIVYLTTPIPSTTSTNSDQQSPMSSMNSKMSLFEQANCLKTLKMFRKALELCLLVQLSFSKNEELR